MPHNTELFGLYDNNDKICYVIFFAVLFPDFDQYLWTGQDTDVAICLLGR